MNKYLFYIFLIIIIQGCKTVQPGRASKKDFDAIGKADNFPALPKPVPMPAVPEPKAVASVEMGNPDSFEEVKMNFPIAEGPFKPTWNSISENYPGYPEWLREGKFGIWVHFGPQASGMSGDWYARRMYLEGTTGYENHLKEYGHPSETGYMDILKNWNPTKLSPAQYVKLYHDIGARFLFIQGVHHDNYDLWNSTYQPWNSVNIGPKRDILGEWAKASKQFGMRYGVTFHHEYTWWWWQTAFRSDIRGDKAGVPYDGAVTLADGKGKWWEGYDPRMLYGINMREYRGMDLFKYNLPKGIFTNHLEYANWYVNNWALRMLDVIGKYDPDFIYTDGNGTQPFCGFNSGTGFKSDAAQRVIASFYNRALAKHGKTDVFSITKFHPPGRKGVVTTFEGNYPKEIKTDQAWIGENAIGDWYYGPNYVYDAASVIRFLLECVSRDGSYAVSVPIKPDGSLEPACLKMLYGIGDWMKINGSGIYGSKAWVIAGEGKDGEMRTLPGGALGRKQAEFQFGPEDFRFTSGKDGSLYAFCMTVPPAGIRLFIKSLGKQNRNMPGIVKSVELLGYKGKISWKQEENGLSLSLPEDINQKIALCFRITTGT